jgi:hypothetical protein
LVVLDLATAAVLFLDRPEEVYRIPSSKSFKPLANISHHAFFKEVSI